VTVKISLKSVFDLILLNVDESEVLSKTKFGKGLLSFRNRKFISSVDYRSLF
jgi:hypothetical protein